MDVDVEVDWCKWLEWSVKDLPQSVDGPLSQSANGGGNGQHKCGQAYACMNGHHGTATTGRGILAAQTDQETV